MPLEYISNAAAKQFLHTKQPTKKGGTSEKDIVMGKDEKKKTATMNNNEQKMS